MTASKDEKVRRERVAPPEDDRPRAEPAEPLKHHGDALEWGEGSRHGSPPAGPAPADTPDAR
jgi:hypothetical protein